ncbi:hypothetical protein AVEN_63437-1 [Araneus ventricosus]|uniref:Uncharacterized protein n=1 Tax=Araneus ventricosus TaxID=182803 RepID=A0A4Y2N099_ARAVE|nr:hypothetical protein AVEN_63437-1 [Araneus ventricosus]
MPLPSSVSLMVGKRNLQRSGEWKPLNPDIGKRFGDKREVLEYTGIEVISLIGSDFLIDFPVASRPVGKTINTRVAETSECVRISLEHLWNLFGVLFVLRVGQVLDAERYCS